MIDDTAVDFLRYIQVKRTVPGFHMVDGDFHSLCHDTGDGGIGISENQYSIGLFLQEDFFYTDERFAQNMAKRRRVNVKIIVGFAQPEVFKEDLIELVIVVLSCMNHFVINVLLQPFNHGCKTNDFRTSANNRENFQ